MYPQLIRNTGRIGYATGLDRAHPLVGGTIYAAYPMAEGYPNVIREVAKNRLVSRTGALAQAFDSSGAYVSFPAQANETTRTDYYDIGGSPVAASAGFAVSVWFKCTDSAKPRCLLGDDNSSDTQSSLEWFGYNSGAPWARSYIGGSQKTISGGTTTLNVWHHCVVNYDGANFSLWLNGVSVASTGASGVVASGGLPSMFIGGRAAVGSSSFYPWAGGMRNLLFLSRSLEVGEIADLYQRPWAMYYAPLRRWAGVGAAGTLKTLDGIARSSIKTLDGVAIGSVNTYLGLTP